MLQPIAGPEAIAGSSEVAADYAGIRVGVGMVSGTSRRAQSELECYRGSSNDGFPETILVPWEFKWSLVESVKHNGIEVSVSVSEFY